MTSRASGLVHVLGRARSADPVTASALALQQRHERDGRPGRLVAGARDAGCEHIGTVTDPTDLAEVEIVVHSVDGGEELAGVLPHLIGRPVTLVHHGSAVGSDRHVLRALRPNTTRALAADPGAREELRALGFRAVERLDPALLDGTLHDVPADQASVENLARHPGPLVLSVGPIGANRSLELLLDAFAALVTGARPSATLSLCGAGSPWYLATLHERILTRGLLACELRSPATDAEVQARLDRADAVVALHPTGLDPFLRRAARAGVPIVAPMVAATAGLPTDRLVPVSTRLRVAGLTAALQAATERVLHRG